MLTAVVALLASVIAALVTLTIERRGARRASEVREEERRRALRLVERELVLDAGWLADVARTGRYFPITRRARTSTWTAHQATLAGLLGTADWRALGAAYEALEELNDRLEDRFGAIASASPENLAQAITSPLLEVSLAGPEPATTSSSGGVRPGPPRGPCVLSSARPRTRRRPLRPTSGWPRRSGARRRNSADGP